MFVEESDVDVELDVGWVVAAGRDPEDLFDRLTGRVPVVHLKHTGDEKPVERGDGDVDVTACANAARDAGAKWLVYEHDDPTDPLASLDHGAKRLTSLNE